MGKPSDTTRPRQQGEWQGLAPLLPASDNPGRRWTGWHIFSLCVLCVLGFASAFSYIWDFDIFWHLACGEWMFRHGEVMRADYFCLDADPKGWIDVHWFFQVIVTAVYKLGSWELLSVFKGVAAAAILAVYVAALRRRVPTAWLIGVGILLLYVMQARLRVRPEIFTLSLLLVTIGLIDSVRRGGSPRRLWWMVPVMVFWVNMHGLFFLGLAILWGSLIGAVVDYAVDRWKWPTWTALSVIFGAFVGLFVQSMNQPVNGVPALLPGQGDPQKWISDNCFMVFGGAATVVFLALGLVKRETGLSAPLLSRRVLLPIAAATLACLISPWPLGTVQLPVLLSTRLSDLTYVNGVTELNRTFQHFQYHYEAILLVLLTACAMLANFRFVPLSHVGIFAVFVAMGLMARRNVGMLGPIMGFLLALHGAGALKELGDWKPFLRRVGPAFVVFFSAVAIGLSSVFLTGAIQRYWHGHGAIPGAGLQRENVNIAMGKYLADLDIDGDLMCENFGDGGVFDYYLSHGRDEPRRKLYMDGRLEAHSLQKFNKMKEYRSWLSSPISAASMKFPDSIRFVQVRFDSEPKLSALMQAAIPVSRDRGTGVQRYADRYRLIYIDQAGALFARMDWNGWLPGPRDRAKLPDQPNFEDFDLPLTREYAIEGAHRPQRDWHRQNAPAVDFQIAKLLLNLGRQPFIDEPNSATAVQQRCVLLAIRHFHAASTQKISHEGLTRLLTAQAYAQRAWQDYYDPSKDLPVNIDFACSLRRFEQMRLRLPGLNGDEMTIQCQAWADTLVHAGMLDQAQSAGDWMNRWARVKPSDNYGEKLKHVRDLAKKQKVYEMPLLERARELASPRFGLINEAIALLQKEGEGNPQAQLLLGDLLLREGAVASRPSPSPTQQPLIWPPIPSPGNPSTVAVTKPRPDQSSARAVYSRITLPPGQAWQLSMRLALCDWVEGRLWPAADALKELAAKTDQPAVKFYHNRLAQELGDVETVRRYSRDADLKALQIKAKGLR